MMINPLSTTSGTSSTNSTTSPLPSQTLNQADFLKLLVTQMTSQDPLSPESNTDMAAQMAQFSALQASQNTEKDVQGLQADNLLGRTVTLATTNNGPTSGIVSAVQLQAGMPSIVVNGQSYDLSQITAITPTLTTTAPMGTNPVTLNP